MSWIRAIALDLDGTIATDDVIASEVLDAIKQAQYRGIRMLLVTGRTIAALRTGFPGLIEGFDAVVAENGGVLMVEGRHRLLTRPVNPTLVQALQAREIPLQQGEVLVGLSAEHDVAALHEIARLGLGSTLLRNRGQLMILPTGVSKGAGLLTALAGFAGPPPKEGIIMSDPGVNLSRYVVVAVDGSEASREACGKDTGWLSCLALRWRP